MLFHQEKRQMNNCLPRKILKVKCAASHPKIFTIAFCQSIYNIHTYITQKLFHLQSSLDEVNQAKIACLKKSNIISSL